MVFRVAVLSLLACCLLLSASPAARQALATDNVSIEFIDNLVLVGELEHITFLPQKLRLRARIDTGATTSSIGVVSQKVFERDGNKWVQFTLRNPSTGELVEFNRPLSRTVLIKRHGAESVRRNVVHLELSMGGLKMKREFSLTDRSKFKFPVLIGRNVLFGKFVVDVSRKYAAHFHGEGEEE